MELKRPFSEIEWVSTPQPVRLYILMLEKSIAHLNAAVAGLTGRTEKLEQRAARNSQNSNQPPSADGPYKKPVRKKKTGKKKRGAQKGHIGHRQQLLTPDDVRHFKPEQCSCGHKGFDNVQPFYTHQHIELPPIELAVTHLIMYQGCCTCCGKTVSAKVPPEQRFGYGPRISALIGKLSGMQGASRQAVQQFMGSVFGLPISTGAIQKVIDRVSLATEPAYETIGTIARSHPVAYVDETSWFKTGKLQWLWVMVTAGVALYLVHPKRSRDAFRKLVRHWQGILVSDNFSVYQDWVNKRQNCLAHYIRKARQLSESTDDQVSVFGDRALMLLQQLCRFAKTPPSPRKWKNFYSNFLLLLMLHEGAENPAGHLARSLASEMDSLWVFLEEHGVDPPNNRAERALRFGVIWRKRCFGCQSDKGARWVERILSLKETCRLKSKPSVTIQRKISKEVKKDLTRFFTKNAKMQWRSGPFISKA
jgi:transposase